MFKVTEDRRFTHDVKVMVPTDGGHSEESFKAEFRVVDIDNLGDTASLEGQQETLRRVVVSMSELVDDEKNEMPYSDELRDRLIRVPYVRSALLQTYLRAITKTRAGN